MCAIDPISRFLMISVHPDYIQSSISINIEDAESSSDPRDQAQGLEQGRSWMARLSNDVSELTSIYRSKPSADCK